MERTIDIRIEVVIGIYRVKFSFFITMSPGSLPKKETKSPEMIKTSPITIRIRPISDILPTALGIHSFGPVHQYWNEDQRYYYRSYRS